MEEWRDIEGYEGLYQVSNLGRVKSLPRTMYNGFGFFESKEKLLKLKPNPQGYLVFYPCKEGKVKTMTVHQAVAIAFLGHTPCGNEIVVDHINENKKDNCVENLRLVTHRYNLTRNLKHKNSSDYIGVCYCDGYSKPWKSTIFLNGKSVHLGYFSTELEAAEAYNKRLAEL